MIWLFGIIKKVINKKLCISFRYTQFFIYYSQILFIIHKFYLLFTNFIYYSQILFIIHKFYLLFTNFIYFVDKCYKFNINQYIL